MYEYEYFSRETLGQATKSTLERLKKEIERAQRKIEYLKSEDFKKIKRRYRRWTMWYIDLAKTGRYTEKELDRIADKISDIEDTLRDDLAADGWYIGEMNSIELPEA